MDPLAFTTSLITVITAAQATVKGIQKLNSYRNGVRELGALALELESVQTLLEDIASFVDLKPRAQYSSCLPNCVHRASSKFSEINQILASFPCRILKLINAGQAQLVWALQKQRLDDLRDDIRVIKADLAVRLGLVSV